MYLTLTRNLENLTKRQNWCQTHTINLFFFKHCAVLEGNSLLQHCHIFKPYLPSSVFLIPKDFKVFLTSLNQPKIQMAIFAIFEHSGNIVPVTSQCTIKTRVNLLFMSWNSFKKKVVMKENIPRRAHFPSPFHVSLIIWVCPHLSLPALALPYQSLFYIHFIKAASGQKKKKEKKHKTSAEARVWFLT